MSEFLCIYHVDCLDGMASAFYVNKAFRENGVKVEFVAGRHGADALPDVAGKHVIMVDFSYKNAVLKDLASKAASILILDHHASAKEDLAEYPAPKGSWNEHMLAVKAGDYKVAALFDMARSGAQITFDYFFFSRPRDRIVDIVADRDLWQFKLPETEAFYSVICSYELNFENFGRFAVDLQDGDTAAALAVEGEAILRQQKRNIQTLIRQTGRKMVIGGIEVPVINAPYYMVSEACTALSEANPEAPFVASYYDAPDQRTFSLRVRTGDADVSKVAALYGGGGHPKASGFSRPHGWEGDQ